MLTGRRRVALAVAACVASAGAFSACGGTGAGPSRGPAANRAASAVLTPGPLPSPASRLVAYAPPPPAVPNVTLAGRQLAPAQVQWRVHGAMQDQAPSDDAHVTTTQLPRPGRLAFELAVPQEPLVARLLLYPPGVASAAPAAADATEVDCFAAADCHVTSGLQPGSVQVVWDGQTSRVRTAVLYVEYGTQEAADTAAGIAAYRASWVARFLT